MSTSAWSSFAVVRFGAGNGLALILLLIGWAMVDRGDDLGSQVAWLNISVAGLVVALWVNVRWLLDGRRAVGVGMRRIAGAPIGRSAPAAVARPVDTPAPGELVAGPGLTRYHHSNCPLAAGKRWTVSSVEAHADAGRTPCGVCRP